MKQVTLFCDNIKVIGLPKSYLKEIKVEVPKSFTAYEALFYPQFNAYQVVINGAIFTFKGLEGKDKMFEYSFIDVDTINIKEAQEIVAKAENVTALIPVSEINKMYVQELKNIEWIERLAQPFRTPHESDPYELIRAREVLQQVIKDVQNILINKINQ